MTREGPNCVCLKYYYFHSTLFKCTFFLVLSTLIILAHEWNAHIHPQNSKKKNTNLIGIIVLKRY